MRNNLLFIVPPCVPLADLILDENKAFSNKIRKEIPLGAVSLATYMKSYTKSKVHVLDLNLEFYDLVNGNKIKKASDVENYIKVFITELKDKDFDFCGISAIFSPVYGYLEIISRVVKEIFSRIIIFAGGGVPSNLANEVFASAPCIDVISYGEGEIGISGYVNAEDEQKFLDNSPSLITRDKLKQGIPYSFEFIENLDEIPPLDFSLIDFEKYNSHAHAQNSKKVIAAPLMFSRGCPFDC